MLRVAGAPCAPLHLHAMQQKNQRRRQHDDLGRGLDVGSRNQQNRAHGQRGQSTEQAFDARQFLCAEPEREDAKAQRVQHERRQVEARHVQRAGELRIGGVVDRPDLPGAGGEQRAQVDRPPQRGQRIPAKRALLSAQKPHHEEHRTEHARQNGRHHKRRALAPQHARVLLLHMGRGAEVQLTQTRRQFRRAHDPHPDGVDALLQRCGGQRPPARHVPALRQGLGQRPVAPQQGVVEIDRTGHVDAAETEADGGVVLRIFGRGRIACDAAAIPVDAVPHRARVIGPAARPEIGQGDRFPALRGAHFVVQCGACRMHGNHLRRAVDRLRHIGMRE